MKVKIVSAMCKILWSWMGILYLGALMLLTATASQAAERRASISDTLLDARDNLVDAVPDDGAYFLNSVLSDVGDVLKLPFEKHDIRIREVLTATVLIGSIPATIYGLDNPIRRNVRKMNDNTANALEYVGLGTTVGGLGLIYGWGVFSRNEEARHVALTGVEGVGAASLVGLGLKAAFGRKRPSEGEGSRAFFKGGESFPSERSTIAFAAAAALSEGFNNKWWVAAPAYSLALATGIGRMGKDAHWASDVLTAALIGAGTTKLLFYLHRDRNVLSPLFVTPMVSDRGVKGASLGFNW